MRRGAAREAGSPIARWEPRSKESNSPRPGLPPGLPPGGPALWRLLLPLVPDQIRGREEEGDLRPRVLGRIGSVHAVRLDALAEQLADGAGRRLARPGPAHE